MTYRPYKIIPAVLVALLKDGQVLLARRAGTGYMDGWYGLPGGHLEEDETLQEGAAREVLEEVGIKLNPKKLELFHIYQNMNTPGRQYAGFIFRTDMWIGEYNSKEDKVEDVELFDLDRLPDRTIPYHKQALSDIKRQPINITYTPIGSFDPSGK